MAFVGGGGLSVRRASALRAVRSRTSVVRCVAEVKVDLSKAAFPATKEGVQKAEAIRMMKERFDEDGKARPDHATVEWFLADRRYDVDEAYEKLTATLSWRQRLQDVSHEDVEREYLTEKAKFYGELDKHSRKVLIVHACKHISNEFPFECSEKLIQRMMDGAVESMSPGTETILGIIDMRGFGVRNSDVRLAQLLIDVFFTYYPRRLSELLVVDAPLVFQPMWGVVKPLLGKYSSIVRFCKAENIQEYFKPEQLPDVLQEFQ